MNKYVTKTFSVAKKIKEISKNVFVLSKKQLKNIFNKLKAKLKRKVPSDNFITEVQKNIETAKNDIELAVKIDNVEDLEKQRDELIAKNEKYNYNFYDNDIRKLEEKISKLKQDQEDDKELDYSVELEKINLKIETLKNKINNPFEENIELLKEELARLEKNKSFFEMGISKENANNDKIIENLEKQRDELIAKNEKYNYDFYDNDIRKLEEQIFKLKQEQEDSEMFLLNDLEKQRDELIAKNEKYNYDFYDNDIRKLEEQIFKIKQEKISKRQIYKDVPGRKPLTVPNKNNDNSNDKIELLTQKLNEMASKIELLVKENEALKQENEELKHSKKGVIKRIFKPKNKRKAKDQNKIVEKLRKHRKKIVTGLMAVGMFIGFPLSINNEGLPKELETSEPMAIVESYVPEETSIENNFTNEETTSVVPEENTNIMDLNGSNIDVTKIKVGDIITVNNENINGSMQAAIEGDNTRNAYFEGNTPKLVIDTIQNDKGDTTAFKVINEGSIVKTIDGNKLVNKIENGNLYDHRGDMIPVEKVIDFTGSFTPDDVEKLNGGNVR